MLILSELLPKKTDLFIMITKKLTYSRNIDIKRVLVIKRFFFDVISKYRLFLSDVDI